MATTSRSEVATAVGVYTLYIDDSGTRHPDKGPGRLPAHGHDWFALGGIIIADTDRDWVAGSVESFKAKWDIKGPLHSAEIRAQSNHFAWLGKDLEDKGRFLGELTSLITKSPVVVTACVIDRPGYNRRYREKYGDGRWSLCKTAFHIVVERAAKFARQQGARLRVYVERSGKLEDQMVRAYYDTMRASGSPFDHKTSAHYVPLGEADLAETLYEFRTKRKSSPLVQLADLCLWPVCIGGYDPANRPYTVLKDAGLLLNSHVPSEEIVARGIKYSCMEPKNEEPGDRRALVQPSYDDPVGQTHYDNSHDASDSQHMSQGPRDT